MNWRAMLVSATFGFASLVFAQVPAPMRADVAFFISNMVERHAMDADVLRAMFSELKPVSAIVKAVSAPSTNRPWHEYRPLFVDTGRIDGGVRFWNENQAALARAAETYGVPESIIVSIIGVETRFGKVVGNHRVLDALYTLGFDLPGRNEYFKSEMEAFLLLTREQGWSPASIKGSYAGAMGMPQFMPTSYRKYAVDFNTDGTIDLWKDTSDVIGSVANFLYSFGWRRHEPIAVPTRYEGNDVQAVLSLGIKPHTALHQLKAQGVVPSVEVDEQLWASVLTLDGPEGPDYWLCFANFNAILQYNRSRNYAMSVHQLALEIARERQLLAKVESSPASPARR